MQKEYRNTSTHVVDLPDGRTLAPGEVAEVEFEGDEDEAFNGLRADGLLAFVEEPKPGSPAKGKSGSSRKTEGEEE